MFRKNYECWFLRDKCCLQVLLVASGIIWLVAVEIKMLDQMQICSRQFLFKFTEKSVWMGKSDTDCCAAEGVQCSSSELLSSDISHLHSLYFYNKAAGCKTGQGGEMEEGVDQCNAVCRIFIFVAPLPLSFLGLVQAD